MATTHRIYLLLFLLLLFQACSGGKSDHQDQEDHFDSPLDSLNELVESTRGSTGALLARARFLAGESKFDEALADVFLILQKDSNHLKAHSTLAEIYLETYQSQMALRTLDRITKLYPDSIAPILQLAEYQLILQQYDQSKESVAKVLELDPQNADALFLLGLNFKEQGDRDRAIAALQSAVEINPELTDAWLLLGNFMEEINPDLAGQYYDNAVRVNPQNISALHSRAFFLQNQNRFDEAIELYDQIKDIDPGYADAYLNTGILYILENDYDRAIDQMTELTKIDSTNALAHFYLGRCYELMDDRGKAIDSYNDALRWSPSMQRAREAIQNLEGI